jgi:hypothetical protein
MGSISNELANEITNSPNGKVCSDGSVLVDISFYYEGSGGSTVDKVVFKNGEELRAFFIERTPWGVLWDEFDGNVYFAVDIGHGEYEVIL